MLIELRTILAGPEIALSPGHHDLPDALAEELIAGGYAVPVSVSPAYPTAEPAEAAEAGSAPDEDVPPVVTPDDDDGLDGDGFVEVTVTGKRAKR